MSKPSVFSNPAFQKSDKPSDIAFNLISKPTILQDFFNSTPLSDEEAIQIKSILSENNIGVESDQLHNDSQSLQKITGEVRAIGRQSLILLGERVKKARELLKSYKDGAFTRWMETAFGSKKSGYNALNYYELHEALPGEESKEAFKKLPNKAAYILASREADIEVKAEILSSCREKTSKEAINLIKKSLPSKDGDKRVRTPKHKKLIQEILDRLEALQKLSIPLDDEDDQNLELIIKLADHERVKIHV